MHPRIPTAAWLAGAAGTLALMLAPAGPAARAQAVWSTQAASSGFSQQALDTMLAPIALYPDALLAQVLMAATYPLDVVEAARYQRAHPGLSGDALAAAVEPMGWDPSVKALVQFPSVLAMMDERLDWTRQLGAAFLEQGDAVMDTVQALRARAYSAGQLRSGPEQRVIVQAPVITIEPAVTGAYWVPYYNPLVVYGNWWWPAHPPFFWIPPAAYRPPHFAAVYTTGIAWGAATVVVGALWHNPRPVWRHHPVIVDNVRVTNVIVTQPHAAPPSVWHHDSAHRGRGGHRGPGGHPDPGFPVHGAGTGAQPTIVPSFSARPGAPERTPTPPGLGFGPPGPGRPAPPRDLHAPVPRPPAGGAAAGAPFPRPGARPDALPDARPDAHQGGRPGAPLGAHRHDGQHGTRPDPEFHRPPQPEFQRPPRPEFQRPPQPEFQRPPQAEFPRPPRLSRPAPPEAMRQPAPPPPMRPASPPAPPAPPMRTFQPPPPPAPPMRAFQPSPPPQARPGPAQHEPRGGAHGREFRQPRDGR